MCVRARVCVSEHILQQNNKLYHINGKYVNLHLSTIILALISEIIIHQSANLCLADKGNSISMIAPASSSGQALFVIETTVFFVE